MSSASSDASIYAGSGIDIIIILIFLASTLAVGFGHGLKNKNMDDYSLGGRSFSTGTLVATIVATWASGSGFFITLSRVYLDGLYDFIASLGMGLSYALTAIIFIPRMGEFLGDKSVAESMGKLYGQQVRVITGIAGTFALVGLVAVQFKAFGNICGHFLNLPSSTVIILAGVIVTAYSAFGGIKAVTFTDVLQLFTFGFSIPLVGIMIWNQFSDKSFLDFTTALQDPKFSFAQVLNFGNPDFWQMIPLFCYFAIPGFKPHTFQRILIGKNIHQVKTAFLLSALLILCVQTVMAWVPFLLFNSDPNLESNQLLGNIIDNYTFVGLTGLLLVGVIAMAMSTADSCINTSSVLFANDICSPFDLGEEKKLSVARSFSLFLGTAAIFLALFTTDLLSIILSASSFYVPIVAPPLIMSIFGFRSSGRSVLIGMAAGFATVVFWKFSDIKMNDIVFAMGANFVFLIGSHYLLTQKGGWVGIKDKSYLEERKLARQVAWKNLKTNFHNFHLWNYLEEHAPRNRSTYMGFGIYCMMYSLTTIYSTGIEVSREGYNIMLTFYQIMLVTGTVMAMYPIWPLNVESQIKERIVQSWWFIAVFYMLIVFSSFFVMVSDFSALQFALFSINTIIAIILLRWRLAMFMIPVGFYIGVILYQWHAINPELNFSVGSPAFIFMYILIVIGTTLMIFLKPDQERLEETEEKLEATEEEVGHFSQKVADQQLEINRLDAASERILNNVNHELRLPVGNVMNFAEMINSGLENYSKKQLKELSDEIYKNSNRLSTMILNMLDLSALKANELKLQKQTMNFSELVQNRVNICKKTYLDNKNLRFDLHIEPDILIKIDPNYIRQSVDNLIINSIKYSEKGTISINVRSDKKYVYLDISDEGIGIPKLDIYDIFKPFKVSSKTLTPAEGRGVGLALCKRALQAHGGDIEAYSDGTSGTSFKCKLPR